MRLAACLFLAAPLFAAPSVVSTSGRKLLVAGQPFTIQGVDYSPTPVGSTLTGGNGGCVGPYQWWIDRPTYVADFSLIQKLGANTLRTYNLMNSASMSAQVLQALDEAQVNHLYVVMGYFVSSSLVLSDPGNQNQIQSEVLAAVNAYKNHPAVLMWAIGNEVNLTNGFSSSAWYVFLNSLAGQIKTADPNHPVTTVEGDCPQCAPPRPYQLGSVPLSADDAQMTNLDLWSVTSYRGKTFQGLFAVLASSTTKPVFVAEFGKDAYHDAIAQEDQDVQASYISFQWSEIAANLSAEAGILVGGTVFEWTDEWWKDTAAPSCLAHGTAVLFTRPDDTLDPNYQDEWFGIAAVSPVDAISNPSGTARQLRKSYSALQGFWNPTASKTGTSVQSFFSDVVRNYPNPFRVEKGPTKWVAFTNEAGDITITIYDAGGQRVKKLPTVNAVGAGRYEMNWDGRSDQGGYVSPGLYIARVEGKGAHEDKQFRRVVAVK